MAPDPRIMASASIQARERGDIENGSAACGQSAGLIHDIVSVRQVIDRLVSEAEETLTRLGPG